MGSSASKVSRAAGSAARQYPTRTPPTSQAAAAANAARPPPPPPPPPPPVVESRPTGPSTRPPPQASASRSEAINLDASDPDFARSLRSLGPVQPNPTMSQSSAFPHPTQASRASGPDPRTNPAILVLDARARLQAEADEEFMAAGRRGHAGRQFLDVYTIRQMLVMRDGQQKSAAEIEKALGLKTGTVDRLGMPGVVELAQEVGRADRGVNMV